MLSRGAREGEASRAEDSTFAPEAPVRARAFSGYRGRRGSLSEDQQPERDLGLARRSKAALLADRTPAGLETTRFERAAQEALTACTQTR